MSTLKTPVSSDDSRSPLLVREAFEETRRLLANGVPTELTDAVHNLRSEAEGAMDAGPFTVIDKKTLPPTGDMHDYMSLSVYFWPNPATPDGLPYVARDGEINPEVNDYDRPILLKLINAVQALATGYALLGEERYAAKAADLLRVFFLHEDTRMNPNMLFAQYIPGTEGIKTHYPPRWVEGKNGKGVYVSFGGVIESSTLPALLECIEMLRPSDAWTDADHTAMQGWVRAYMNWLQTHQHGKDEASTKNNHAMWYWVQISSYALFCGEPEIARKGLEEHAKPKLLEQMDEAGLQFHEVHRTIGLFYTTFATAAMTSQALNGERVGVDLWNFKGPDGRSIKLALDWLMPYLEGKPWDFKPAVKPFRAYHALPVLCAAARRYDDPRYAAAQAKIIAEHPHHPYRLLYPLPPA